MPAPYAGDAVYQRQVRVGMRRGVGDAEVGGDEGGGQAGVGDGDEQQLREGSRTGDGDPCSDVCMRADEG